MKGNYKVLQALLLQIFLGLHFFNHISALYETMEFFRATKISNIVDPRGLFMDTSGDILVLSNRESSIFILTETEKGEYTKTVIVEATTLALTHSVSYRDGFIYASSESAVYRWPYVAGSHSKIPSQPEVVIDGIPDGSIRDIRAIIFDGIGRLYVAIGAKDNVDPNSERARIRRFQLDPAIFPIHFNSGEIFADGIRNTVGIAIDANDDMWGVDIGATRLFREDLGGDIQHVAPAIELNRFLESNRGRHYGYPWCFSTDVFGDYPKGTQFAWPLDEGAQTDEWCRNVQNNIPPILAMPAHEAPLGLRFFRGQGCGEIEGAFPCAFIGDAIVALHGNFNNVPPFRAGYRVVRLPFTKSGDKFPTGEIITIIHEPNTTFCSFNCFRPVNAIFNNNGHLIISDATNNEILRVTYEPNRR